MLGLKLMCTSNPIFVRTLNMCIPDGWKKRVKKKKKRCTWSPWGTHPLKLPHCWRCGSCCSPETVLTTVTEAPLSDTAHNTGCPRSPTVHPRFAIPLQVPRCMALLTPGTPKDTYSCNNACGGDTEFIKGGDISSG